MEKAFEVSIVVFHEDSSWVALALEMDVRGYGDTRELAVHDLLEMLVAQIGYAVQKGHPESVWQPAEARYWEMFEEARRREFIAQVSGTSMPEGDAFAETVPLPQIPEDQWIATVHA